MEHWKVLSATMAGWQEKYLNSRRCRMAKTATFWPWGQSFNSFCFESHSLFSLFPFFSFFSRPPRCLWSWQMFFKKFFRKHLCWSFFLRKLQAWRSAFLLKKRLQYSCFPVNIAKFLRTIFFFGTPPVHYTFPKFYVVIEFFGRLWVHFLCHCFVFLHNSLRISIPRFFRTCFHIKIVTFVRITTSAPVLLWELWIWVFWILCFVIIFLDAVLQGMAENNPTEKQINAEIQVTLKNASAWKLTEEKL